MFKYIYAFIDKIKSKISQKGQGMIEYALIIAFVAAIAALALNSDNGLGEKIQAAFGTAGDQIDEQVTNAGGTPGQATPKTGG